MCKTSLKKFSDVEKLSTVANKHKVQCRCGAKTVFYPFENKDKKICRGCHHYVFVNSKAEFKYKLEQKIKK